MIDAHKFYLNNKEILLNKDKKCGCFYCLEIFEPNEIKVWINDTNGTTAVCTYCGIDSVIGKSSNVSITKEFLKKMKEYWF
ncbi:MAG: cytoplasmic protein [Erysipelotrichales bacterium]|nr:cytoplasmic protein [Erysipelotrichales bacterium]